MNQPLPLKQRLLAGTPVYGTLVSFGTPPFAEMLSKCGFDFLWLDLEHSSMSLETVHSMLAAMNGSGCEGIVRVPINDPAWIKRALDLGPSGVIIPMVNSRVEAEAAVRACLYPPAGIRGVAAGRAHGYGFSFTEYVARANDDLLIIPQVEHIDAVNVIDEILQVKRIDVVFIGPFDLSGSLGRLGDTTHPEVVAAIDRVVEACQAAGKPVGILAKSAADARHWRTRGFCFLPISVDCLLIGNWMNQMIQAARRQDEPGDVRYV